MSQLDKLYREAVANKCRIANEFDPFANYGDFHPLQDKLRRDHDPNLPGLSQYARLVPGDKYDDEYFATVSPKWGTDYDGNPYAEPGKEGWYAELSPTDPKAGSPLSYSSGPFTHPYEAIDDFNKWYGHGRV